MLAILKKIMDFEAEIVVDAPLEKVFSLVADFSRDGEWTSSQSSIVKTSEGPLGVGTTFRRAFRVEGQTSEGSEWSWNVSSDLTVTEFEPNRRLSFDVRTRSFGMTYRYRHHFGLTQVDRAIQVTQRAEWVEMSGPAQAALLAFSPVWMLNRWMTTRKMRRLKKLLQAKP